MKKLIFVTYTILLLYMTTLAPSKTVREVSGFLPIPFDKSLSIRHSLGYALEGFLASAITSPAEGALIASSLGALSESVQAFVPYRSFDVEDLLANLLGSLLGALAYSKLFRGEHFEARRYLWKWANKGDNDRGCEKGFEEARVGDDR